ncbi:adenosylmethionine--8-amino-7-oxononanoate transaminase [soil metagenome]|nr:adenosylmethionine--8-amino-7-oxononanoate transaminase [Acidobacteriota bacterium]
MSLTARDQACLWHPYTQMRSAAPPLPIVRGKGVYLYTEDGRKILDGVSSWWVNIHGHSHPRLNQALIEQAQRLEHVVFAGCTHPPAVELAERLIALLPPGLSRVFYSDNGSTAVEVAVKLAWQYWRNRGQAQRRLFLTLAHAYHGDTVGAMSVSADSVFTGAFAPLLFPVARAHAPYCFRCPLGLTRDRCHVECLDDLEQLLEQHGETVAGVIVEPMLQGAGGMIVWPAEFLSGVRRLCDRFGTLLIADEVLTGFGRTGRMFACEHAGITPDIICLSKALTAGYLPLGATIVTGSIYEAFLSDDHSKTFFHGHSFTANALACAVAVASLDLFEEGDVLGRVIQIEAQLRDGLSALRELPQVGDVRVIGGVGAVEFVSRDGRRSTAGYLDGIGTRLASALLERGLLVRPLGSVLYLMPPYVISPEQLAWVISQMTETIRELPD